MNLITAVSDCNARPCQKLSYILRVELVLEAKVGETPFFSSWVQNLQTNTETGIAVMGSTSRILHHPFSLSPISPHYGLSSNNDKLGGPLRALVLSKFI